MVPADASTLLAFLLENQPAVLDPDSGALSILADVTVPGGRPVRLSSDGRYAAFCVDTNPESVWGGPLDAVEQLATSVMYCNDSVPWTDGTVAWIDAGVQDPPMRIRFHDQSGPARGDASGLGGSFLWGLRWRDAESVVAVSSLSSDYGPLLAFDRSTGSSATVVAEDMDSDWAISPDGRAASGLGYELTVGDLAGRGASVLLAFPHEQPECDYGDFEGTQSTSPLCWFRVKDPSWSPDGTRIAFSAGGEYFDVDDEIFVIDVASGALTRVTDDGQDDREPAWSRDGQMLYWSRYTELVAAPADGSAPPVVLVEGRIDELSAVWPP